MRRLVPFVLLWALAAAAHDADVIYVTVQPGAQPDRLELSSTLTPASLALLAPLDADGDGLLSQEDLDARTKAIRLGFWEDAPLTAGGVPCEWLETRALLREGFVELQAEARCGPGELRQDFKILRVLPANYRIVLGSQLDGEARGRGFAQGSLSAIPIPRPPAEGSWDEARFQSAFEAGLKRVQTVEVIFAVLGLLLCVGEWKRGIRVVAVLCVTAGLASGLALPGMTASVVLVLAVMGAAAVGPSSTGSDRSGAIELVIAAVMGFAIGARDGGGGWVTWLGLATATVPALFVLGPIPLALGTVLAPRPRVLKVVRWLPALVVLGAVLFHAQQAG